MSVYQHPHKPGWQMIKISHGRQGKPEYIPFPGTREEAQIYERELRGITDTSDPAWADKMPMFKQAYKNQVMDGTYTDFGWALKQLEPFFGLMKIRHITPSVIEQYKAQRLEQVKRRTVNRELSYLSKFLDYCGSQVRPGKFRKKDCQPDPPDVLTMAELQTLISHLTAPVKHIVQLMAFNGLRKSEAFQIRAVEAEKDGSLIRVCGKGGRWRMVPVELPELKKAIAAARKARPDGYLFPNPKTGRPYNDIRKAITRACTLSGIEKNVYPHLCRHSFATALVGQGVNLRIVQGLLGHADLKMVQTYTHLNDPLLRSGTASLVAKVATGKTRASKRRAGKTV